MPTRSIHAARVVRFAGFALDVRAGELRQGDRKIRLQDQPRRILAMLLEHPGEVVLREEICKRLWPNGTVVEVSHGINAAVLRLRDALGDSADDPRFVETVARRGYRFLAAVEVECRPVPSLRRDPAPGAFHTEALAGQSLSHFRIEEMLGRGGMGVVYRAEDLSLGRMVALKFLPAEMAGDPVAVGRFQREARLASSLNHPNICTVHAVEECAGQPVIVMELLEGRTLEAVLAAGPMPAETALPLAIQMAAALDAAHRRQIVHRDLKPGNVMVTGRAPASASLKVLDFGLAKQSVSGASRPGPQVTRADSIVGTPSYMAPERFHGKEADARSDIYSLGLVVVEMLTGSRVPDHFERALPAAAADVEPVLRRALETNPEERWQTARDLKAALEWVAAARASRPPAAVPVPAPGPVPEPPVPRRKLAWKIAASVLATAAVLVLAGLVWWMTPPSVRRPQPMANALPATPAPLNSIASPQLGRMSLSPDGKLLAYSSMSHIGVRPIDGGDARVVATGPGTPGTPFWSPDGRSLAFTSGGKLFTVSAQGGPANPIADINTALAGAWGPDGTILIGKINGGLISVSSSGGPARQITTPDASRGERRHLLPQFLPGGRQFLYTAGSEKRGEGTLYVGSLDTPAAKPIVQIDSGASFIPRAGPKGYLLFARAGYLMAQAFDATAQRTEGAAFPLAGPIATTTAASATAISIPEFSATPTTLVYRSIARSPATVMPVDLPGGRFTLDTGSGLGLVVARNWMPKPPS